MSLVRNQTHLTKGAAGKPAFSLPERKKVDDWVASGGEGARATAPKAKPARLTIDLDADLHAKFKSACALRGTTMVEEVRLFIEKWIERC